MDQMTSASGTSGASGASDSPASSTLTRVCEVVAETFGLPSTDVTATTTRDDIPEWDSIGHLNLALQIEETFGVSFSVEEMSRLNSVAAIAEEVEASWRPR